MYRLAKSLEMLRRQIDDLSPNRDRASDGWIGDAAHRARKSDHNPDANGVVKALDIDHDPAHGVDGAKIAEAVKADPRVSYVIWDHHIWQNGKWSSYKGKNPHTMHVHISVDHEYDSSRPWDTGLSPAPAERRAPPATNLPILRQGCNGSLVTLLQRFLKISDDGIFGPRTKKAVRGFQAANGLVADGVVGPYTWEKIQEK